ncbi:MAG: hypothetical protein ACRD2N_14385 [Vicinamibacterales bacterium]
MKTIAFALSLAALAGSIVPAVLFFYGYVDIGAVKVWMLVATVVWFGVTPAWMKQ